LVYFLQFSAFYLSPSLVISTGLSILFPCIAILYKEILYKQKCLFSKNGGQEGKTGPVWGLVPVGQGGYEEKV
jgi:hypothetical protein